MFRIYSCYVQEDYQKPEAHSISFLSLFVSHVVFPPFFIIYHSPPPPEPQGSSSGAQSLTVSRETVPVNLIFLITEAQIKSKGPDGLKILMTLS